jgi:hypothetical protein
LRERGKFFQIAQDERTACLNGEGARRAVEKGIEQARHHAFGVFGRLIGIDQRRAVNNLLRTQRAGKELRGIGLECRELSPTSPILGL